MKKQKQQDLQLEVLNLTPTTNLDNSIIISSWAVTKDIGYPHYQGMRLIRKHLSDLEEWGSVCFENRDFKTIGGNKNIEVALLNRHHFFLLVTLFRNRKQYPQVLELKKKVVRYIKQLEKEILNYQINHANSNWVETRNTTKITRRSFTDVLQDSGENKRMHGHAYSSYTNLMYKAVLGFSPWKYKKLHNLSKEVNLVETFNQDQLTALKKKENLVMALLDNGKIYDDIKEII